MDISCACTFFFLPLSLLLSIFVYNRRKQLWATVRIYEVNVMETHRFVSKLNIKEKFIIKNKNAEFLLTRILSSKFPSVVICVIQCLRDLDVVERCSGVE